MPGEKETRARAGTSYCETLTTAPTGQRIKFMHSFQLQRQHTEAALWARRRTASRLHVGYHVIPDYSDPSAGNQLLISTKENISQALEWFRPDGSKRKTVDSCGSSSSRGRRRMGKIEDENGLLVPPQSKLRCMLLQNALKTYWKYPPCQRESLRTWAVLAGISSWSNLTNGYILDNFLWSKHLAVECRLLPLWIKK